MGNFHSKCCTASDNINLINTCQYDMDYDDNRKETEFENWLQNEVKLPKYLKEFEQHKKNDHRQIKDFNKNQIQKIIENSDEYNKKQKKRHCKKFMEHVNHHKRSIKKGELITKLQNEYEYINEEEKYLILEEKYNGFNQQHQNLAFEEHKQPQLGINNTLKWESKKLFYCWFDADWAQDKSYKIKLYLLNDNKIYLHQFSTTFQTIKSIYQSVKNKKQKQKYFATKGFPHTFKKDRFKRNKVFRGEGGVLER
eukprot:461091_1